MIRRCLLIGEPFRAGAFSSDSQLLSMRHSTTGNQIPSDQYLGRSIGCGFPHVSAAQFGGSSVCESSRLAFEFDQVLVHGLTFLLSI